ncbi:MAG: hypothetical protein IKC07_02160 [Clostridia bacterium]|nr:hypothetical protein [Clostridia bacterium]
MTDFLTKPHPTSLLISGREYKIRTDFRIWIKISEIFSNMDLHPADKIIKIFSLIFTTDALPSSIDDAIKSIGEFLSPFSSMEEEKGERGGKASFSFSHDGGLIYAAFLSQYGIDLTSAHLHWWRFLALLFSLEDCKFTEIVKIRALDLSAIKDTNQKRFIRKLKRLYRLPSDPHHMSEEIGKIF